MRSHDYDAHLIWDGNRGDGTSTYQAYGREYHVVIGGKPDLAGSANPTFRGDASRHDPEDMFLSAISSCHMLSYLALCARKGVSVVAYEDHASGKLVLDNSGGGKFEEIVLRPRVTIASGDTDRAMKLHETAHQLCFIASSCSVPIRHEATIQGRGDTMNDLTIALDNRPGALAEMGEALGAAGISIEGGGVWGDQAHFLFADGEAARRALEAVGIRVVAVREVLIQKLRQGEPGQLGKIARRMAAAGVNIEVQYSDHDHQLILVVDDLEKGHEVSREWMEGRA